ncbi:MAG: four helix bundle protein [bacterium]
MNSETPAAGCSRGVRLHRRLVLWQKSVSLVEEGYRLTAGLPASERYGLAAQLRRAAVSIPSNIAEGAARQTKREFAQFLFMARGSMSEVDTQMEIARRLGFLGAGDMQQLDRDLEELMKLLHGVLRSLGRSRTASSDSRT